MIPDTQGREEVSQDRIKKNNHGQISDRKTLLIASIKWREGYNVRDARKGAFVLLHKCLGPG